MFWISLVNQRPDIKKHILKIKCNVFYLSVPGEYQKSHFSAGLFIRASNLFGLSWKFCQYSRKQNDWERVSMHRVVTLNTLCIASIYFATQNNRSFSEPPTFFEENNVLSNLRTTLFFARYCVTFSLVRWANFQSISIILQVE